MNPPNGKAVEHLAGSRRRMHTLVTGGAGFIGANLADRLLSDGERVVILDNLSRPGVEKNLRWLSERYGDALDVMVEDIRDASAARRSVAGAKLVFHFAAQVAVTTSMSEPVEDFSVNAQGTLNLLEALRARPTPPPLVMTSTNKVYGALDDVPLTCEGRRYDALAPDLRAHGISEARPLDFHSPYGCSKGAADQYVRDYARSYGLATVVFRMSCIYGPHQFGTEDQGWVAHFMVSALRGRPVTLYGDGMQVRDILFVDDLVEALLLAGRGARRLAGQVFNIGGGPSNVISLLELLERIEALHGTRPPVHVERWRPGDQRYYVSDTRRFQNATGWRPTVSLDEGLERLYQWLRAAHGAGPASVYSPASIADPGLPLQAEGAAR